MSGEAFLARACATRLRARGIAGYQAYATADLGSDRVRDARARGARRRRGRARRDRPARAPATRCAEGEVGEVVVTALDQHRLSADPLRDRRPVRRACRGRRRAAAPTCASRAGWDAPTRRRRSRACSCTRRRSRRSSPGTRRSRKARLVVDNPDGNDRMTLHVEVRGRTRRRTRGRRSSRRSATSPSCAAKWSFAQARGAAERRQGDRRRPQDRLGPVSAPVALTGPGPSGAVAEVADSATLAGRSRQAGGKP